MRRFLAVLAIAAAVGAAATAPALGQSEEPAPIASTTTRAPLRPFDPPEPEPLFIPDLVSDLVQAELGAGLEVSRLSANADSVAPGTGPAIDWSAWAEFALPAAIPLLVALALVGLTRVPRRLENDPASDSS